MAKKNGEKQKGGLVERFGRWIQPRGDGGEGLLPMAFREGPVVDVTEDENSVHVTAELPGLEKDDFELEMEGNRLILQGEKKMDREEKDKNYYYSERSYGSFYRAIPMPCEIEVDKIKADYKQGVLKVTLPKTVAAKASRTKVKVG